MNRIEHQEPDAALLESAWPAGHRIGNFELQVASFGGSGIVYRAWDFALARAVALKEYMPAAVAQRDARNEVRPIEPEYTEAFERGRRAFVAECQTLARCDHPSLARVLHLMEAHGTAYCVMPWYAGRSMLEVRPKEALVRSLLKDFLGALETYHRLGGTHGSLSPSKVLLLDNDHGLLLGPSVTGQLTRPLPHDTSRQPTDKAFAAVEQTAAASGQPQGPWTDFYALAAIVRLWMTGLPPPGPGLGPSEPLAATIGRQSIDRPAVLYSEELLRALDAALSIDIGRRPQTAAEFRRWLEQAPSQSVPGQGRVAPPPRSTVHPPSPATSSEPRRVLPAVDTRKAPAGVEQAEAPEDEVDLATVDAIRRAIASIPDSAGHAPRRPGPDSIPHLGLGRSAVASAGVAASRAPAPVSQSRTWPRVWVAVGVLAVAAAVLAFAAWDSLPRLDLVAENEQELSPPAAQPQVPADLPARPEAAPDASSSSGTAQPAAASVPAIEPVLPGPGESRSTPPATPTPQPVLPRPPGRPSEAVVGSPRALCGARTEFSLYRCMQQQCSQETWKRHPQCLRLKTTDVVE